ncbi:hypothetical protein FB45DRAFT_1033116 [Roridomyces roridus]|uniref:Uncharacterized protein n=1 Tax=Roridomyces roridus TaxID=1738132 RepID=A0AAD7BGY4_9AGAR|nr:hypothetical protein FB45DRAFT_1033116 [Roridomyces roridus]
MDLSDALMSSVQVRQPVSVKLFSRHLKELGNASSNADSGEWGCWTPNTHIARVVAQHRSSSTIEADIPWDLVAGLIVAFIVIPTLASGCYWYRYRRRRPRSDYSPRTSTDTAVPPPMTPMRALTSLYPPTPLVWDRRRSESGCYRRLFGQGYAPIDSCSPSEYNLPLTHPTIPIPNRLGSSGPGVSKAEMSVA